MKLIQKRFFNQTELEIRKSGLYIKTSKQNNSNQEAEVPYDDIAISEIIRTSRSDKTFMSIIGVIALILLRIVTFELDWNDDTAIILLCTLVFGFVVYKLTERNVIKEITIPTYSMGYITFYDENPSQSEVGAFLTQLKSTAKSYLIAKYGTIDFDLPMEPQLMNLARLREIDVIDDEEYVALKDKALGRDSNANPIGFTV